MYIVLLTTVSHAGADACSHADNANVSEPRQALAQLYAWYRKVTFAFILLLYRRFLSRKVVEIWKRKHVWVAAVHEVERKYICEGIEGIDGRIYVKKVNVDGYLP